MIIDIVDLMSSARGRSHGTDGFLVQYPRIQRHVADECIYIYIYIYIYLYVDIYKHNLY